MTDIGSGVANEDLYAVFDTDAGVAKKVLAVRLHQMIRRVSK